MDGVYVIILLVILYAIMTTKKKPHVAPVAIVNVNRPWGGSRHANAIV